jgi:hypothetical protein
MGKVLGPNTGEAHKRNNKQTAEGGRTPPKGQQNHIYILYKRTRYNRKKVKNRRNSSEII